MTDAVLQALPHQLALFQREQERRVRALVGGYGSGKTLALVLAMIYLGIRNAPHPGIWIEPTYQLIGKVALPAWESVLSAQGIPWRHYKADRVLHVAPGANNSFQVWFFSGDNPDRIVGVNASHAAIDEPGVQDFEVFKRAQARVRIRDTTHRWILLGGTPEGMNWFHDVSHHEDTLLVRARTDDNVFNPPEYADAMTSHLSGDERRMYRDGHFVALGGSVYHRFDTTRHVGECPDPFLGHLEVWADFNIGKMAWFVVRILGNAAWVLWEHVGENVDTESHAEALIHRFEGWAAENQQWDLRHRDLEFIVDASASNRNTAARAAAKTDSGLLASMGFGVKHLPRNPPIKDRVSVLNYLLHHDRISIDPGCKYLINCLQKQGRDPQGMPEKKGDLDHGPDAIGYGAHYHWRFDLGNFGSQRIG